MLSNDVLVRIVKYNPELFSGINEHFASLCEYCPITLRLDPDETLTYMKTYIKGRTYIHKEFNLIGDTLWCKSRDTFLANLIDLVRPRVCHLLEASNLKDIDTIYYYGDILELERVKCNTLIIMSSVELPDLHDLDVECKTIYIAQLCSINSIPDIHYYKYLPNGHNRIYFAVKEVKHIESNIYLTPVRQYISQGDIYLNEEHLLAIHNSSEYILSDTLCVSKPTQYIEIQLEYDVISMKTLVQQHPGMLATFIDISCTVTDVDYPLIVNVDDERGEIVITYYGYLYMFHHLIIES